MVSPDILGTPIIDEITCCRCFPSEASGISFPTSVYSAADSSCAGTADSAVAVRVLASLFRFTCGQRYWQTGQNARHRTMRNKAPLKRDSNPRTPVISRLLYRLAIQVCCGCLTRCRDFIKDHDGIPCCGHLFKAHWLLL